jgi:hypothetical protein
LDEKGPKRLAIKHSHEYLGKLYEVLMSAVPPPVDAPSSSKPAAAASKAEEEFSAMYDVSAGYSPGFA